MSALLISSFILVAAALPARQANGVAPCAEISKSESQRLVEFVRTHFRLAPSTELEIRSDQVRGTCLYRLQFTSKRDSSFDFRAVLLPDHVFLAPLVYDTREALELERARAVPVGRELPIPRHRASGSGKLSVIIFSDYQCPACAASFERIDYEALAANPNVELTFRHFPLPQHKWAREASVAGDCVARQSQNEFWAVSRYFFTHQRELAGRGDVGGSVSRVLRERRQIDMGKYQLYCILGSTDAIDEDVALGRRLGVEGTPWVFLNGERVGSIDAATLENALRRSRGD